MSKDTIVKRDVGERVDVMCTLDSASTKELGDGVFEVIVTTSRKDRTNENIKTDGIDTSSFVKTGGPVLWGHDYSGLPIGKTIKLIEQKNKMKAQFQLAVEEYPFAATVAAMVKGGYVNSASIGGIVRSWSDDYTTIEEMEMVEFSLVSVPANADAIMTSRSLEEMTGKSIDTIKSEAQEMREALILDKMASMEDDEVKDAIKVLDNLIARLKDTAAKTDPQDTNKAKQHIKRFVLPEAKEIATQSHQVIKTLKIKLKG